MYRETDFKYGYTSGRFLMDITASPTPRTLVLCFDGTALKFGGENTNVVKLFAALERHEPESQLVYYQAGIGTYRPSVSRNKFTNWSAKVADQAFGVYLQHHVMGGYRFLMHTYRPGDSICFFGFSRGAYTARALAGMLHKVGLLPAHNEEQIVFAYEIYRKSYSKKGHKIAEAFMETYSREVKIDFIGAWDTVSSIGLFPKTLPFTATNPSVKTVRHAIALDECRINFRVNLWRWNGPNGKPQNDVKQVWFAGDHSDIGGGKEQDSVEHSLSYIPLRWMIRQCQEKTHIKFDKKALIKWKIQDDDGREIQHHEVDESEDATSASRPSFSWNSLWWIPELIPFKLYSQTAEGEWKKSGLKWNRFEGRLVRPEPIMFVHSSVPTRMRRNQSYKPRAKLPRNVQWGDMQWGEVEGDGTHRLCTDKGGSEKRA